MFRTCVFCGSALPGNDRLEHFPVGRRVAYDPERGRLWAVCGMCGRWNLAPFEERWEALEELERLATGPARTLARTDNVALLSAPGLDLVRVGPARLAEEAWWRYGRDLLRRRRSAALLLALDLLVLPVFTPLARHQAFGRFAHLGEGACPKCGAAGVTRLTWHEVGRGRLALDGEGRMAIELGCLRCGASEPGAGPTLTGAEAQRVMRGFLAWAHFAGAPRETVAASARAIDAAGSAEGYVREVARAGSPLWQLEQSAPRSLALEIALNDDAERRLLRGEAAMVERQWEEEERIAAIADRLV
ncbi:MAG: hypothetical protein ACJ8GN_12900 [Longimicrobiaceae bacterium]